jgi:hypothetical protein
MMYYDRLTAEMTVLVGFSHLGVINGTMIKRKQTIVSIRLVIS